MTFHVTPLRLLKVRASRLPLKVRLYHAKDDTTVSFKSTEYFYESLRGKGVEVEVQIADEGGGHGGILVDLMLGLDEGR